MALCKKPFRGFGCGQCLPCRIVKRRIWTHRIMLEAQMHEKCSFLTLTYDPENEPPGRTLDPDDVQLWMKRFRERLRSEYGIFVRQYLIGEYGDETQRPHYHSAPFGS